jgi:site-specific DNA-methyltransferase (adenine-specific)
MQDRLQKLFPVNYRNGKILMINADCMKVMQYIKGKEIELAIVDPPYGIGKDGNKSSTGRHGGRKAHTIKSWDSTRPNASYFQELFRVSCNQIIWGANYYPENLIPSMGWIVWDKGQRISQSDGELAFSSFNKALRICTINRVELLLEGTIHPTQKPVALYKWLLKNYAKPSDCILDTHGGSGSICIACHDLGFELTWIELDRDYYDAAVDRYRHYAAQGMLFESASMERTKQNEFEI